MMREARRQSAVLGGGEPRHFAKVSVEVGLIAITRGESKLGQGDISARRSRMASAAGPHNSSSRVCRPESSTADTLSSGKAAPGRSIAPTECEFGETPRT